MHVEFVVPHVSCSLYFFSYMLVYVHYLIVYLLFLLLSSVHYGHLVLLVGQTFHRKILSSFIQQQCLKLGMWSLSSLFYRPVFYFTVRCLLFSFLLCIAAFLLESVACYLLVVVSSSCSLYIILDHYYTVYLFFIFFKKGIQLEWTRLTSEILIF